MPCAINWTSADMIISGDEKGLIVFWSFNQSQSYTFNIHKYINLISTNSENEKLIVGFVNYRFYY